MFGLTRDVYPFLDDDEVGAFRMVADAWMEPIAFFENEICKSDLSFIMYPTYGEVENVKLSGLPSIKDQKGKGKRPAESSSFFGSSEKKAKGHA